MSSRDNWSTPQIFRIWFQDNYFAPSLDVCADEKNYFTCREYYNYVDNGLTKPWHSVVWCNPPYSQPHLWVEKAIKEKENCKAQALLLRGDFTTKWFQKLVENDYSIIFLTPRIQFDPPEGIEASTNNGGNLLAIHLKGFESVKLQKFDFKNWKDGEAAA